MCFRLCIFFEFLRIVWSPIPSFISWRLYTSYICPYAQRVWIARNSKVASNFVVVCSAKLNNFFFPVLVIAIWNWNIIYFCGQGLQEKIKLVPIDLEDRPFWYKEKVYPPNKVTISTTLSFSVCFSYLISLAVTLTFYSFIIHDVLFGCQDKYRVSCSGFSLSHCYWDFTYIVKNPSYKYMRLWLFAREFWCIDPCHRNGLVAKLKNIPCPKQRGEERE